MFLSNFSKNDKDDIEIKIKKNETELNKKYLVFDVFYNIMTYLQPNEINNFSLSSKKFNQISNSNVIWKFFYENYLYTKYNKMDEKDIDYKKLFIKLKYPFLIEKKLTDKNIKINKNLRFIENNEKNVRDDFDYFAITNPIPKEFEEAQIMVKFHERIRGCSIGLIAKSEIENAVNIKTTRYFRDGTIMLQDNENILNRLKTHNTGSGQIKVFYPIEKDDIVGNYLLTFRN